VDIGYLNAWRIDVGLRPKRVCRGTIGVRAKASAQDCLQMLAGVPPSGETPAQQSEGR